MGSRRDIILVEPATVTVVLRRLSADHVSAVDQRKKSLMVVSVVKLQEPLESLRQAIELCGGFEGVGRDDKSASPAPPIQGSRARPDSVSEPLPLSASVCGIAGVHAGCMIRLATLVTSFLGMSLMRNMLRFVASPATSVVLPLASAL